MTIEFSDINNSTLNIGSVLSYSVSMNEKQLAVCYRCSVGGAKKVAKMCFESTNLLFNAMRFLENRYNEESC